MNLSQHFHLAEFTASQTAERLGRPIIAPPDVIANLERLCTTLLEPIRIELGRSIIITSGYRPDWLNAAIGGSAHSAHMQGLAADVKVVGMAPREFSRWVMHREFEALDQCIMEGTWTHLAVSLAVPRHEYLTASFAGGKATYTKGIA